MVHHIYVVELDKKVHNDLSLKKANPNYIKDRKYFYVGQTGKTPEQRFKVTANKISKFYKQWV